MVLGEHACNSLLQVGKKLEEFVVPGLEIEYGLDVFGGKGHQVGLLVRVATRVP